MSEPKSVPLGDTAASRRVLHGLLAVSGGSFGVMAVQVGYAALTSRLLNPADFGAYAVALTGAGLIATLAGASIGQAAARSDDSLESDRFFLTLALAVAPAATLIGFALAPWWAQLWRVPESVGPTRFLLLGLTPMAVSSVLAGILRRTGRTPYVAARSALGQLIGLAVGLIFVLMLRDAWTLCMAAVSGWLVTVVLLCPAVGSARLRPRLRPPGTFDDFRYAIKSGLLALLRQVAVSLPPWATARFAGAAALGSFNRATTLITMPLDTIQRSLSYTLFPEMRPGSSTLRSHRSLTELVSAIAWTSIVLGGLGYFLAAPLVLMILGPSWGPVGSLAGLALLLGVLPMVGAPIATALESRGHFSSNYAVAAVTGIVILTGVAFTKALESPTPAIASLVVAAAVQVLLWILFGAQLQLLGLREFLGSIGGIALAQACVTIVLWGITSRYSLDQPGVLLAVLSPIAVSEIAVLWLLRRRTTLGRILGRRDVPGFRDRRR